MSSQFNRRRGFTLVEVLTFVTSGTVIFMLAIQLLHVAMNISSESKDQLQHQQTLAKLSRDLRSDLQLAVHISLSQDAMLTVQLPDDRQVQWLCSETEAANHVMRRIGSQPVEQYQLGEWMQAHFIRGSSESVGQLIVERVVRDLSGTARVERKIEFGLATLPASPGSSSGQPPVSKSVQSESQS